MPEPNGILVCRKPVSQNRLCSYLKGTLSVLGTYEQQEAIEFDGLSNEGTADESETELAEAAEDLEQIKYGSE
jgi:hypothetical protein